ncbi:MAG: hypothetical protein M1812_003656 [Candelaria pacifica]|nr:MAG: hypothetical protein M1812_003656 [Candelaria pacifica]
MPRAALNIPKSVDILNHIYSLPETEQHEAMNSIKKIESEAMAKQTPQGGLAELMEYLERRGVRKVNHLLSTFLPNSLFFPIITREFRPPKPDPAGILHIAERWDLENRAEDLIMVGDSVDDMTAGFRAGAATVLLVNEVNAHLASHEHTDFCIKSLDDLIGVLENGFEGDVDQKAKEPDTKAQAEATLAE